MKPSSTIVSLAAIAASMGATAWLAGCAATAAGAAAPPEEWRNATVVSVLRRSEIAAYVDRQCVPPEPEVGHEDSDKVALVRYRLARARYLKAFAVKDAEALHPGEHVQIETTRCAVRLESGEGA